MSSTFGSLFRITTWGEACGSSIGVVIDGCPAGLPLSVTDITDFMNRSEFTADSEEKNMDNDVEIVSGLCNGRTFGSPVSILISNKNAVPEDRFDSKDIYRPGHADYTYDKKFGFRDFNGMGRLSSRETASRIAAGAVAEKLLEQLGIKLISYPTQIGPYEIPREGIPSSLAKQIDAFLNGLKSAGNSCGGIAECRVINAPAGLGEPIFDKLDATLAQAVMSIGSVKGVEIGDGFASSRAIGSENNDMFAAGQGVRKLTNHSGGTLGGISDGSDIIVRAAIKPVPSIAIEQETVTIDGKPAKIKISGCSEVCLVHKICPVVEAMTALTLADALLINMSSRIDNLKKIYTPL